MNKDKELLSLLCKSILVSRFARDYTERTTEAEKILHIKLNSDEPDIAQEMADIITYAEHTAYTLGEILNIKADRITFSIEVIKNIRDVMNDEELLPLIEMHMTCSDEEFEKMVKI